MPFSCGSHRAFVYAKGGVTALGEITPLTSVRWERLRDEISTAQANIGTEECCELLGDLRTVLHELHIERNGEKVWQGPITRLEYEFDQVRIFAEDMLWQSKRRVLEQGYSQKFPNITSVISRMHSLMSTCYPGGDGWRVTLHPHTHANDPRTSRVVNDYQFTIWEDFDKYAEDSGADYTVVNRQIHYFDNHLAWNIIPDLDETHLSQWPRIVEYGNELATRGYVTNGQGQAGTATNAGVPVYGLVDWLQTNVQDATQDGTDTAATPEEVAGWAETAANLIDSRNPAPVAVVIPENSTLLPTAPWTMAQMIPGSWFRCTVDTMCRTVSAWQRLHHVGVSEEAPAGETVQITAVSAPSVMVVPP